jgi:hypothetical protein
VELGGDANGSAEPDVSVEVEMSAGNSVLYRLAITFSPRSDPHGLKSTGKNDDSGQFGLSVRRAAIKSFGAFSSNMIHMPACPSRETGVNADVTTSRGPSSQKMIEIQ